MKILGLFVCLSFLHSCGSVPQHFWAGFWLWYCCFTIRLLSTLLISGIKNVNMIITDVKYFHWLSLAYCIKKKKKKPDNLTHYSIMIRWACLEFPFPPFTTYITYGKLYNLSQYFGHKWLVRMYKWSLTDKVFSSLPCTNLYRN